MGTYLISLVDCVADRAGYWLPPNMDFLGVRFVFFPIWWFRDRFDSCQKLKRTRVNLPFTNVEISELNET